MKNKNGFTLIELLVVISIIALLMAVMMPALGRAKGAANSVVCRSNLKQILMASLLWGEDNDDWSLPCSWSEGAVLEKEYYGMDAGENPGSIEKYLDSSNKDRDKVFACPTAKQETFFEWGGAAIRQDRQRRITYGINGWMTLFCDYTGDGKAESPGDMPNPKFNRYDISGSPYPFHHGVTRIKNVRRPDATVYFADHFYPIIQPGLYDPAKKLKLYGKEVVSRWHNKNKDGMGMCNIAWVDGHSSQEPDDFGQEKQDGQTPRWCNYFWNH